MTLRAILWRLLLIKLGVMRRRHRRRLARIAALEAAMNPPRTKSDLERILLYGGLHLSGYAQIMRNPFGFGGQDTTLRRVAPGVLQTDAEL